MKALAYLLIAAAGCWILSEILEIIAGGRTGLTLAMTAAFHLLMAAGIWGAYAGQLEPRSGLSRLAAGIVSVGFTIIVYPPIAVALDPSLTIKSVMTGYPLFTAAGMLATWGTVLFGAALLLRKSYPVWIGIVLMVSPPVFTAVVLTDGPALVGFAANVLEGIALITMGMMALRRLNAAPEPGALVPVD